MLPTSGRGYGAVRGVAAGMGLTALRVSLVVLETGCDVATSYLAGLLLAGVTGTVLGDGGAATVPLVMGARDYCGWSDLQPPLPSAVVHLWSPPAFGSDRRYTITGGWGGG